MDRLVNAGDATLDATVDFAVAAASLFVVAYPAVAVVAPVVGTPFESYGAVALVSVAVGGAYPFVAGNWSLRRLTDYLVAFLACVLTVGVLAMLVIGVSGLSFAGTDPAPRLVVLAAAYPLAYGFVAVDGFGILAGTAEA